MLEGYETIINQYKNQFLSKNLLRTSKPVTLFLGPQYTTSLEYIEIDITYQCNLRCLNCDRSCRQAPDDAFMTINQLKKFITESEERNKKWKRIRLLGGEPFLHPNIEEVLRLFSRYKEKHSETKIEVVTNGFGKYVKELMKKVPGNIIVKNTNKTGQFNKKFEPFNISPCDLLPNWIIDYSNGCWITAFCGLGLNPYGYYPCGVASSIDRVMGFDIGLKSMPMDDRKLKQLRKYFCKYCGHFFNRKYLKPEEREPVFGEPQTQSWQKAYLKYKERKPSLTRY